MKQYRLQWRTIPSIVAAEMEDRYGRNVWKSLTDAMWEALPWAEKPTSVVFTDGRFDQYTTLRRWADSHDQPIRDVVLEQREVPESDTGWTPTEEP